MKASGYFYKQLAVNHGFPNDVELEKWRQDAHQY